MIYNQMFMLLFSFIFNQVYNYPTMLRSVAASFFSKLKINDVLSSNYDELANMIIKKYSNKEYKNSNSICLHQIQHRFNVIQPGDTVLDIGAGPDYYWTDLALKLSQNQELSHKVISNDLFDLKKSRPNNHYVKGNFMEQQIRTNIALQLGNTKFNTILIDVSPEFTGNLNEDGFKINQVIFQALYFSNLFLNKGGNLVCKVLNCESVTILDESSKIYFHQTYNFKPSIIRQKSPVSFYVMKGFAMNFHLEAMKQFISKYRGNIKNKTQLVKEYQNKYNWDPIQIIGNKAKNDILMLKQQGKTDRDIQNMFCNDPFVKVGSILKQIRLIDKAKIENDGIALEKAINKFTDGKLFSESAEVPNTREEWIDFLQKIQKKMKNRKSKQQSPPSNKLNLQPLGDNQVYMKDHLQSKGEQIKPVYIQEDLTGNYEQTYQKQYIQRQIAKMKKNFPDKAEDIDRIRKRSEDNKKTSLDEVFNFNSQQKVDFQKDIHDLGQSLRAISDQQYKDLVDKQRYFQERQDFINSVKAGNRTNFKNK